MKQNVLSVWKLVFTRLKVKRVDYQVSFAWTSSFFFFFLLLLLLKSRVFHILNGRAATGWISIGTQPHTHTHTQKKCMSRKKSSVRQMVLILRSGLKDRGRKRHLYYDIQGEASPWNICLYKLEPVFTQWTCLFFFLRGEEE